MSALGAATWLAFASRGLPVALCRRWGVGVAGWEAREVTVGRGRMVWWGWRQCGGCVPVV